MQLTSTHINHDWPAMRYQLSDGELAGLTDLLRFYGPYAPLRRMTTYFGVGGSLPLYSGHVYCFDYDYIVRKILGLSGFSGQLNRALYAGGKGASGVSRRDGCGGDQICSQQRSVREEIFAGDAGSRRCVY